MECWSCNTRLILFNEFLKQFFVILSSRDKSSNQYTKSENIHAFDLGCCDHFLMDSLEFCVKFAHLLQDTEVGSQRGSLGK